MVHLGTSGLTVLSEPPGVGAVDEGMAAGGGPAMGWPWHHWFRTPGQHEPSENGCIALPLKRSVRTNGFGTGRCAPGFRPVAAAAAARFRFSSAK